MLTQLLLVASATLGGEAEAASYLVIEELRASRLENAPPDSEISDRIAQAGLDLLAGAFEILETGEIPPLEDETPQILSVPQEAILLNALGLLDPSPVREYALVKTVGSPDPNRKRAVLNLLGKVGDERDIKKLFELTEGAEGKSGRALVQAFQAGMTGVLHRSTGAYDELAKHLKELPANVQVQVVFALGKAKRPEGIELLLELFDREPGLRITALTQAGTLGTSPIARVNEDFSIRAGEWLLNGSASESRTAALYLAQTCNEAAIPELIQLLDSESKGVRENGLYALKTLSGLNYPGDSRLWTLWHEQEKKWFLKNESRIEARLACPNDAEVAATIQDIACHRLHRDQLASYLVPVLQHHKEHLRVLACTALGALRSQVSIRPLLELLPHPTPSVSSAAHLALQSVTGLTLANESELWAAEFPPNQ